jgi:hypothetical protein
MNRITVALVTVGLVVLDQAVAQRNWGSTPSETKQL